MNNKKRGESRAEFMIRMVMNPDPEPLIVNEHREIALAQVSYSLGIN